MGPVCATALQQIFDACAEHGVQYLVGQAVDAFPQETELWLQYVSFERKSGQQKLANQLHFRATKTLHDDVEFTARFNGDA